MFSSISVSIAALYCILAGWITLKDSETTFLVQPESYLAWKEVRAEVEQKR